MSHKGNAIKAMKQAIRDLEDSIEIIERQDDDLKQIQEDDDFSSLDDCLCLAIERLMDVEDALSAAGKDYFEDETSGKYRIGIIIGNQRI